MRVSVIIPTYNRADMLRDALVSVFDQTHDNLEVIVVDDGSDDHTGEILAEFGNRAQSIRLDRSGISAARNTGIDAATGEYLAFLDSDDLWLPKKIEHHLKYAVENPHSVLTYTDAIQFAKDGPEKHSFVEHFPALKDPSHLFTAMITRFAIPLTSTIMIKTSFLKETGLRFPIEIGIGEDLWLFLQILATGIEFGYFPEKLTMRRMHDSNISGNHRSRFEQRKLLYANLLRNSADRYTSDQKSAIKLGLRDATYRVAECDWNDCSFPKARQGFLHTIAMDSRGMRALAYGMLTFLPSNVILRLRRSKSSA
ncbi:MAG TPA: glycosyltransferase family A protein [Acidobacteriaceae bacterium]|nr:glycosyltransferase family A protein [Acidobacteriaceae bacterium]